MTHRAVALAADEQLVAAESEVHRLAADNAVVRAERGVDEVSRLLFRLLTTIILPSGE